MPNHLLGPVILPLGDAGVTVNFGDSINDAIHTRVIELDRIVQANPPPGFTELIPSYCALFVGYDPLKGTWDRHSGGTGHMGQALKMVERQIRETDKGQALKKLLPGVCARVRGHGASVAVLARGVI